MTNFFLPVSKSDMKKEDGHNVISYIYVAMHMLIIHHLDMQ